MIKYREMEKEDSVNMMEVSMANKKNSEGYADPTAFLAERAVEEEAKQEERRRMVEEAEVDKRYSWLVGTLKLFANMAGFEIKDRIHLRHKRTGREFR